VEQGEGNLVVRLPADASEADINTILSETAWRGAGSVRFIQNDELVRPPTGALGYGSYRYLYEQLGEPEYPLLGSRFVDPLMPGAGGNAAELVEGGEEDH